MIIEHIIALIAPHECLGCQKEGLLLCGSCISVLPEVAQHCYVCRRPELQGQTCPSCTYTGGLASVQAVTPYKGDAKELVRRMKFGRTSAAAESIALAMAARLQLPSPLPLAESSVVRGGPLLVTWIPTATARVRARGYDQSRQIARSLARQIGCPIAPLLARSGQQRQVGHSRAERLAQLQAAYRPVKPWLIDGKDILLVDDVFTTGATLSAAAEQLHAAGARSVHAYVFARA